MPGPQACSHPEQSWSKCEVGSVKHQETSSRPPRHRACAAECLGLHLYKSHLPHLSVSHTCLPPSPVCLPHPSVSHNHLSPTPVCLPHLSASLTRLSPSPVCLPHPSVSLTRLSLQKARHLEGDAGHQRESFIHSVDISGAPSEATFPPPCLLCIFGTGGPCARTSQLRPKPGVPLLCAPLSLLAKEENSYPKGQPLPSSPRPLGSRSAASWSVKWEHTHPCLDYFEVHT
ncbi:unnamed protein product [Nyctereutes procyonoides]|uniref:(raccoon dog) hypothetical protein n=1 Tax=Nyctereutes procyonoides TaxID=34880 RepID=A0A811ZIE3_NYCPR|nr:unnamed protein product [Nyctereutes procyonoides]